MAAIGYARVSTKEQTLNHQLDALKAAGAVKIFTDEGVSGAKAKRPGLEEALEYMRAGDVLTVIRLDRLGRNTRNLLDLVEEVLVPRRIELRSLTESIDTTTPMGKMLFTLSASFAELERDLIRERVLAGIEAARARGRFGGRPPKLSLKQKQAIYALHAGNQLMGKEIAAQFGVSRATIYNVLTELRNTAKP